nr:Chain D, DNA POLYMERASE fragment [synthetic construct]
KKASLFDMFDF